MIAVANESMVTRDSFLGRLEFNMTDYKHFRVEDLDETTVLHLHDAEYFDRLVINELQDEMVEFVKTQTPDRLLISFGPVRRMSSELIGGLIKVRDWTVGNDGHLKLCDMHKSIREVFKMMNLDGKMFEIHDSMPQALDAFDTSSD